MRVKGLEEEIYFINNPLYVQVDGLVYSNRLRMEISPLWNTTGETYNLYFKPYNEVVSVDLAPSLKTYIPLPSFQNALDEPVGSLGSVKNFANVKIDFFDQNENGDENKIHSWAGTIIRGGLPIGNNNSLWDGATLIESARFPVWTGYPTIICEIEGQNIIKIPLTQYPEIDSRLERTCDGVYLAWLNSLGGYSFWLFEDYMISNKSSGTETLSGMRSLSNRLYQNSYSTGNESDYTITLYSDIPREYFHMIRSLVASPDVWVYDLDEKLTASVVQGSTYEHVSPFPIGGVRWKKLKNNGNSFDFNSYENNREAVFNFTFDNSENRSVLW